MFYSLQKKNRDILTKYLNHLYTPDYLGYEAQDEVLGPLYLQVKYSHHQGDKELEQNHQKYSHLGFPRYKVVLVIY